ncbi:TRAP transporter permease [Treponema parvum]|uniref:TRAP transporter permease n=1 Tax=Treponema parvum TaxID=138851 RepID=A0A975F3W3_9SPIR|nr:TRAP transporter permease [Treponema parvum]QTQ14225.1 TRAP transporter permease [Treponema parvum]
MKTRNLDNTWSLIIKIIALAMGFYHLLTAMFGIPEATLHRSAHLMFGLVLVFLQYPIRKKESNISGGVPFYDIIITVISIASMAYLMVNHKYMLTRFRYVHPLKPLDMIFGILAVILVLEAARRAVGIALPIISVIFLLYALLGPVMPGILRHRGATLETIIDHLYMVNEGLFGIPIGVSATYIILFIIFGAFLEVSGGGDFFIKLSQAIAGGSSGGTAKVAVVSSALLGTISGSAVANVVTTGTFTIPMMKKAGYKPHFAGAVEAAASSGGQFMPPVMGAAAFVLAEFSGIPYLHVIKYAFIPGTLYFLAIFFAVHFQAIKSGIKGLPKDQVPNLWKTLLTGGYLLLPVVAIVVLLVSGFTPMYAALGAIAVTIALSWINKETRLGPKKILLALEKGVKASVMVISACACAGIVIGVVSLTGLGLKFTSMVVQLSGGMLVPALLLTMVAALILGMGLPTTPAYIVQASLLIPAIIQMGVLPISAHLFALYFSVISNITPPVAISSYAAAGIAGADAMKTSVESVKLGLVAYIVPFMFVFNPALLLIGKIGVILLAIVTSLIGIVCLAAGLQSYYFMKLLWFERIILIVASISLIFPGYRTDLVGLGLLAFVTSVQLFRKRRSQGPAVNAPSDK